MKRSTLALITGWMFTGGGVVELFASSLYDADTTSLGMTALLLGAIWFLIAEVRVWRERVLHGH